MGVLHTRKRPNRKRRAGSRTGICKALGAKPRREPEVPQLRQGVGSGSGRATAHALARALAIARKTLQEARPAGGARHARTEPAALRHGEACTGSVMARFDRIRTSSARCGQTWQKWAKFGPIRPEVSRCWSKSAQLGPSTFVVDFGRIFGRNRSTFGRVRPTVAQLAGQSWPSTAQSEGNRQNIGRVRSKLVEAGHKSVQNRSSSMGEIGRMRSCLVQIWTNSDEPWASSANSGPNPPKVGQCPSKLDPKLGVSQGWPK